MTYKMRIKPIKAPMLNPKIGATEYLGIVH
jgi:hypothetical protein